MMEKQKDKIKILALIASRNNSEDVLKAAKILKDKADEMNVDMKIEKSDGVKVEDRLSDEDILDCDGIIVATDTSVVLKRFAGKRIKIASLAKAISEPQELIRSIIEGEAPVTGASKEEDGNRTEINIIDIITEKLSWFLPFLIVSGTIHLLRLLFSGDPASALYRFFQMADTEIMTAFPVLIAVFVAYLLGNKQAIVSGIIGGLISTKGYTYAWLMDQSVSLTSAGVAGALFIGVSAAYLTRFIDRLFRNRSTSIKVFICPLCASLITCVLALIIDPILSLTDSRILILFDTLGISIDVLYLLFFFVLAGCIVINAVYKKKNR